MRDEVNKECRAQVDSMLNQIVFRPGDSLEVFAVKMMQHQQFVQAARIPFLIAEKAADIMRTTEEQQNGG